jgi:SAM-dependent methyltransferase
MLSLERQNELRRRYRRRHPQWRPATEVYAGLVRRHLTPHSRLLDLGCGRGGLVEQLNHPLRQLTGIDPDFPSLLEHRLHMPRAQAINRHLPFPARCFDVVIASWLLEHLREPARDLHEVARVLQPGGVFVFITPNGRHPLALLNRLLGRLGPLQQRIVRRLYGRTATDTFPTLYRANSRTALQTLAADAGLRLQEVQAIPDPTYLAFTPRLFRLAQWVEDRLPPARGLHLVGILHKP